jgi:hypothetical protein
MGVGVGRTRNLGGWVESEEGRLEKAWSDDIAERGSQKKWGIGNLTERPKKLRDL